jgi:hypothetical protein
MAGNGGNFRRSAREAKEDTREKIIGQGVTVDRQPLAMLRYLMIRGELRNQIHELRGKNLACWCPLNQPCHADVLLELANR